MRSAVHIQRTHQQLLRGAADELAGLGGFTEAGFLSIGESLFDFRRRIDVVSWGATQAVEFMLGEQVTDIHSRLRALADRISVQLHDLSRKTERNGDLLREMKTLLGRLLQPLEGFRKIVKNLLALGVATRIESSVLGRETGCEHLAEELKSLAELFMSKSERAAIRLKSLSHNLDSTWTEVQVFECQRAVHGRTIAENIRSVLQALDENRQLAAGKVLDLQRRSAETSSCVSDLVSSMQFHDITRQQIEHVEDALKDLAGEMENNPDVPGGRSKSSLNGVLVEACGIQTAQLLSARNEMNGAVQNIIDSLGRLAAGVEGMSSEARRAAGMGDRGDDSILGELKKAVHDVDAALVQEGAVNREMERAIAVVVREVSEVSHLAGTIEQLGTQMKIVSTNAGIKAAHAGGRGAALGVIALAIQRISAEALEQTAALADGVQSVHFASRDLETSIKGDAEGDSGIERVSSEIGDVLECLHAKDREVADLLRGTEEVVDGLAHEISRTAASISVHGEFSRSIDKVVGDLAGIVRQGMRISPGEGRGDDSPVLKDLLKRYTMQREREIHRIGHHRHSASKLFDRPESADMVKKDETGGFLGKNVELF